MKRVLTLDECETRIEYVISRGFIGGNPKQLAREMYQKQFATEETKEAPSVAVQPKVEVFTVHDAG